MILINSWQKKTSIKVTNMNNNTYIHKYLSKLIDENDVVCDMTVGNGNDTLFLCSKVNKVIGFDIQDEAINNTKLKTKGYNNVTLINDNHINVDKYINEKIKLFVFNLGYLPNSNSTIITKKDETLIAIKKAYDLLIDNGYLIVTFYIGHVGGLDEYYLIKKYIEENNIKVLEIYKENKKLLEPITYIIQKKKALN